MAEVIKNVPEQKSVPSTSDSSKNKSLAPLKQSKIGFLPRKKVVPSFVKADAGSSSQDSNTDKTPILQIEKTPVKKTYSSDNLINSTPSSEKKKSEENGGVNKSNGTSTTPKKSSESEQDDIPLMKLKHDSKSKSVDQSKSKSKTSKDRKDSSSSKHKHDSVKSPSHKKSSSSSTKKNVNDNKDSSGKKPIDNNHASTPEKSKNNSLKGRLNSSVSKGVVTVEVDSSSDEDEVPLSQIRKKCTPVKSSDYDNRTSSSKSDKISAMVKKNTTPVSIVMGDQKNIPSMKGVKVDQSIKALYNRPSQNGSLPNVMKKIPISQKSQKSTPPPPLHPVGTTKNIIIAIDMDPQKWKSLSPQEQTKIIEHKKELARKHLLAQNKIPPNQPRLLPNHHSIGQQVINVHSNKLPHSNIIISSAGIRPNAPHYYGPRTPNFTSQLNARIGATHIGPMQQSQQFNNFTFTQFNVKQEESTMTDLKPLPQTKKIPMPPGFPNQCFGDVAMIVEFVNTFKKFLIHSISVDAVTLMIGVSPGGAKADVVAQILLLFLKVLLSNEDYKVRGLKMELADLPLTEFTVSFLVCQFIKSQLETKKRLRKEKEFALKAARRAEKVANLNIDPDADESDEDANYDYDYDVAMIISSDDDDDDEKKKKKKKAKIDPVEKKLTIIAKDLESKEFWQMDTVKQLTVMTFLLDLVVQSEDLTDYYDEVAEEKAQAYRDIDEQRKKKLKLKMENAVVTLDQFTKKIPPNEDKDKTAADKEKEKDKAMTEEEKKDSDPFAGMTARQRDAIKSEHERSEEKKREKERNEAEQAKLDYEEVNSKFSVAVAHLKRCLRVEPLGEDRFHRVYWFFMHGIPGLYVSSRCVDAITANPLVGEIPRESWSYFNKEEDINQLLCSLTVRGLREERLKSRLREEHMAILQSIKNIKEIDMHKAIRKAQEKPGDKPAKVEEKKTSSAPAKPAETTAENGVAKEKEEEKKEDKMEVDDADIPKEDEKTDKGSEKAKEDEKAIKESEIADGESENAEKDGGKKDTVNGDVKVGVNGTKADEHLEKKEDGKNEKEETRDEKGEAKEESQEKPKGEKGEEKKDDKEVPKKQSADTEDDDDDEDEKIIDMIKKQEDDDVPYDAHGASIDALKSDIIESANRIVHGSLGELTELDVWSGRVQSVVSVEGLREFVLQIHSCIVPKFFLTPFKANGEDITKDWCKWVEKCMTLSTMHLLYGLLENSIKWESSAEKMRCKVCRRKKGSEQHQQIIVCDGCRFGYHTHCLRPALKFLPEGTWNCPSCTAIAEKESKAAAVVDDDDEVTDHEDVCHECEADGTLILCDTCPLSFHLDCHKPPLRHAPRGNWSCYECTSSRSRRGKNSKSTAGKGGRGTRTSKYAEWSSENEEASSSDEFASTSRKGKAAAQNKSKKNAPAKSNSRKKRAVRNMEESMEEDDEYEQEEEEEEEEEEESSSESTEPEEQPKGRRAKRAASAKIETKNKTTASSRRKKKTSADDEGDDDDVKKTSSSRSSRGGKRKKVEEIEEEEDEEEDNDDEEEEPINSANLKDKIQKFNYKKPRGGQQSSANSDDNDNSNKNKKAANSKTKGKPKKRTKLDNDDGEEEEERDGDSSESNSGSEQWEVTHVSPTLGNKRPCYAKDSQRKKEKGRKGRGKSSGKPANKSESEDEEEKEEEDNDDAENDGEGEPKGNKRKKEAKKLEVLRNMSSADRSFRQAGRNSRRCNYEMQACRNILTSLRKHKDSWPYLSAVNLKQAPDYLSVITKPMDFALVLRNLDDFLYDDALQFIDDVKLIFENSKKYNIDSSPVGEAGVRLHEEFLNLLKVHLPEVLATLQT